MTTLNLKVAASADDGSETGGGTCSIIGTAIRVRDSTAGNIWYMGMRWAAAIAQGSTINSATLSLYVTSSASGFAHDVACESADNAAAFSTTSSSITSRSWGTRTSWTNASPTTSAYNTFDVTSKVQTVINRAGWVSGNYIAILLDAATPANGADVTIQAYDGSSANAAKLDIDYTAAATGQPTSKRFGAVPFAAVVSRNIKVFMSVPDLPWTRRKSGLLVPSCKGLVL